MRSAVRGFTFATAFVRILRRRGIIRASRRPNLRSCPQTAAAGGYLRIQILSRRRYYEDASNLASAIPRLQIRGAGPVMAAFRRQNHTQGRPADSGSVCFTSASRDDPRESFEGRTQSGGRCAAQRGGGEQISNHRLEPSLHGLESFRASQSTCS